MDGWFILIHLKWEWGRERREASPGFIFIYLCGPEYIFLWNKYPIKHQNKWSTGHILTQCYYGSRCLFSSIKALPSVPNATQRFTGRESRHLLLSDWWRSRAPGSPVIHSPVHGKHPWSDLWEIRPIWSAVLTTTSLTMASGKKRRAGGGHISQ